MVKVPVHYQFKCKCLGRGLHFIVLSWREDRDNAFYCPECGKQKVMEMAVVPSSKQIYEVVPGKMEVKK